MGQRGSEKQRTSDSCPLDYPQMSITAARSRIWGGAVWGLDARAPMWGVHGVTSSPSSWGPRGSSRCSNEHEPEWGSNLHLLWRHLIVAVIDFSNVFIIRLLYPWQIKNTHLNIYYYPRLWPHTSSSSHQHLLCDRLNRWVLHRVLKARIREACVLYSWKLQQRQAKCMAAPHPLLRVTVLSGAGTPYRSWDTQLQ